MSSENAFSREILVHCLDGPAALKPLMASVPRATLYRRVAELVEQGFLEKRIDRYLTTPIGEASLRSPNHKAEDERNPQIMTAFPHLQFLPTVFHQDAALMVIGAATARHFLRLTDSLASFAFLGPPMKWKTKLAESLLTMLGAPVENLIYSPAEGGRSLFVRKNARGNIETIRKVLDAHVVAFDEYHKSAPEVKSVIGAYLHGRRQLPFENTILDLKPTPIILANPSGDYGDIKDRLGVDEAQFRRLIVFDFGHAEIPEAIEDKGNEFLQEIRKMGPITLKQPTGLSAGARDRIKAVIKEIMTDKTNLRFVDFTMVTSIIEGLTGYLGEEHAVCAGVTAYTRCLTSIGFASPGCRSEIARAFADPTPAAISVPVTENPFDYQGNLNLLHDSLRTLGRSNRDLGKVADDHALLVQLLHSLGIDPAIFFAVVQETVASAEIIEWIRTIVAHAKQGKTIILRKEMWDGETFMAMGTLLKPQCACQEWGKDMFSWEAMNPEVKS